MNRLLTAAEIAEQRRLDELELQIDRNRDVALTGAEIAGVLGFTAAFVVLLWMGAGCAPALCPGLFA
ncbi:hypothetical protein [Novosphingobium huizhouense]|uniref:hypothetical protein n=1 Tax=Novosphingobium huizhouense TaxID=2866625 RepID=UPI001CD90AC7|nr:hypothetical protein [Novosphingobium huizhouense]